MLKRALFLVFEKIGKNLSSIEELRALLSKQETALTEATMAFHRIYDCLDEIKREAQGTFVNTRNPTLEAYIMLADNVFSRADELLLDLTRLLALMSESSSTL